MKSKSSGLFWSLYLAARIAPKIDIDKSDRAEEKRIMKLLIKGMGWETSLEGKVEGDKITFNKKELDGVMAIIAETHDSVSGGFQIIEEVK
ncbi:hypothetical protein KKB43_04700 [Patescibacteria group bacterium]|nr:hypothetical protein [Patescibacteria group bacterium]